MDHNSGEIFRYVDLSQDSDAIFDYTTLKDGSDYIIYPERYCNLSRFFARVSRAYEGSLKENVSAIKFIAENRLRIVLYTNRRSNEEINT